MNTFLILRKGSHTVLLGLLYFWTLDSHWWSSCLFWTTLQVYLVLHKYLTAKILQFKTSDYPESQLLSLEIKRLRRKSLLGFGLSKVKGLHVMGPEERALQGSLVSAERKQLCFMVCSVTPRIAPHFSCQIN